MWMHFTSNARRAVSEGQEEATRANLRYVTADHIFLGLLRDRGSVAANVLARMTVDTDALTSQIRQQLLVGKKPGRNSNSQSFGSTQLTPRAKRLIDHAYEEARRLGCNYIGTEHLLLGLLRERSTLAAKAIHNAGVDVAQVRAAIANIEGPASPPDTPALNKEFRVNRTGDPWSHFTEPARRTVYAAVDEARNRGAAVVEPEHVLLALTAETEGDTFDSDLMRRLELDPVGLHASLDSSMQTDNPIARKAIDPVPFSARFVTVVNLACDEADRTRQPAVGMRYLLLGILREQEGLAARTLSAAGMVLDAARLAVSQT